MRFSLFAAAGFVASVVALPASAPRSVHEKRVLGTSWRAIDQVKPHGSILLPVRIGMVQSNLDKGHDLLMGISDPASKDYGKHFSPKEVSSCFQLIYYILTKLGH
jgi:tripeptidyl-peptidase-1